MPEMDAVFVLGIKALAFSLLVFERTVDWRQQNETRQSLGQQLHEDLVPIGPLPL